MSNTTTTFDPSTCTLETCSVKEYGQIQYIPTLAGNALYCGIFGLGLVLQLLLGIRYKTWGYLAGMSCGISLEIVGYVGRLMLNNNIFDKNSFIIYLIGLTIGPACLTAAVYLCLGRIITIFGQKLSLLEPRTISILFVCCDFVSLVLQAVGGAIASTSVTEIDNQTGINIMIAGLASQVFSLLIFVVICGHFTWKVMKNSTKLNPEFASLRNTRRWTGMLLAIAVSVLTIITRSAYRLAELQAGFNGSLANDEVSFMILEGPMIIIAVAVLTVWHPGYVMGAKIWMDAGFHLRTRKNQGPHEEADDKKALP